MRNFLTTLLLSQGVPMLLGGDEFGRTQHGNNNAWCQDNELSWFDWDWGEDERALHAFTKQLIRLRREHPSSGARASSRGAAAPGRPSRRVVDAAGRTPDDAARLAPRRRARSASS